MKDNPGTHHEPLDYDYTGLLLPGFAMIAITFLLIPAIIVWAIMAWGEYNTGLCVAVCLPLLVIFFLGMVGYIVQEPNESRVMIFFGKYVGTFRKVGFYWVNPFVTRRRISQRVFNMDIDPIKVNDLVGNPVLIGMVLVWKIRDTYRAVFDIDQSSSPERFVRIQSDAALREVASRYPYDAPDGAEGILTLRGGGEEINDLLEHKINERLSIAGIEVVEARINYLAYAPEIAAVMLRRQQAAAIISAREKIVEGAVSMVSMALEKIEKDKVAEFDPAHRAAMVSNLLVVLCSDEPASPVINASQG